MNAEVKSSEGAADRPNKNSEHDQAIRENVDEIRHEPGEDDERFQRGEDRDRWREAGLPDRLPSDERRDEAEVPRDDVQVPERQPAEK